VKENSFFDYIIEIIIDLKTHTVLLIADSSCVGMDLSRLQDEMKTVSPSAGFRRESVNSFDHS